MAVTMTELDEVPGEEQTHVPGLPRGYSPKRMLDARLRRVFGTTPSGLHTPTVAQRATDGGCPLRLW